jgi:hypothetical protein
MQEISGVGPKTVQKIVNDATAADPFKVERLDSMIAAVVADLPRLNKGRKHPIPSPTHTAIEVPYERGSDIEVVWVGLIVHKNLRDIFEVNRARTGEELDRSEVKYPDLNEWGLLAGYDGTDLLSIRIDRFKYPKFKKIFWGIQQNQDVVLVKGVRPGWRTAREIYANQIWVLDSGI